MRKQKTKEYNGIEVKKYEIKEWDNKKVYTILMNTCNRLASIMILILTIVSE